MAKEIVIKTSVDIGSAQKTLGTLTADIERLKEELEGVAIGSKEFEKLSSELQKANSEVKTLEKTMEGLEPQQKAEAFLKIGEAVAGSFAAAQGAMALVGAESGELEEAMVKANSAIAIAMGARAVSEGLLQANIARRVVTEKIGVITTTASTVAQTAYNTVVGASIGLMKLLRLAMAATGIGALIVGLGLLIANFETVSNWLTKLIDDFLNFAKPVREFLEYLNIIDTTEEKNAKASAKRSESKMKSFEEEEKARKHLIEVAKLQGKSEEELAVMERELARDKFETNRKYVADKMRTSQEVTKEEIDNLNESRRAYELAMLQVDKVRQDELDKEKEALKEKRKAHAEYIADIKKQLRDERTKAIEDQLTREIQAERDATKDKLATIKGNSEAEQQLKEQLQANSIARIQEMTNKAYEDQLAKDKEQAAKDQEEAFKEKIAGLEADRLAAEEWSQQAYEAEKALIEERKQQELIGAEGHKEQMRLIEEQARVDQLALDKEYADKRKEIALKTNEEMQQAYTMSAQAIGDTLSSLTELGIMNSGKGAAASKALAITQIAADTATALTGVVKNAITAASGSGAAAPFLAAAYTTSGIALVLKSAANAKRVLQGGSPASSASGAISTSGGGVSPTPPQQTDNTPSIGVDRAPIIKATVVETDITKTQRNVNTIQEAATI